MRGLLAAAETPVAMCEVNNLGTNFEISVGVKPGNAREPRTRRFIKADIYVRGPEDCVFDMPQLFDACRAAGLATLAYPTQEYWVDIGQIDDYPTRQ